MTTATDNVLEGDAATFRGLWRGVGSTVALIATEWEGQRHAMLATAVTSVSMEPPALLICVNRAASAHDALTRRGAFSLGILGHAVRDLAAAIGRASGPERFAQGDWHGLAVAGRQTDGLPWLGQAQATLFCVTDQSFDYGTHTGLIALIDRAIGTSGDDPLIYCQGSYGRFSAGM